MATATEFAYLHSTFLTILEKELGGFPPVPEAVEEILNRQGDAAAQPIPDEMSSWLDLLDLGISPQRLRTYGQRHRVPEKTIRLLLRFYAGRKPHFPADRDKVDWLATYLFRMRESEGNRPPGWAKSELQEILKGIAFPTLSAESQTVLSELPPLLQDINDMRDLSQITDSRLLERVRSLKRNVGEEYSHPVVLAAIVNYNLVLGKKFDELLKQALEQAHNLLSSQQISKSFDEQELIWSDYHSNVDALQQLSDWSRTRPPEKEEPVPVQESVVDRQLERLGIDSTREASKLKNRIKELANHLRANPAITSVRVCGTPLPLEVWESHSFQTLFQQREQNLRADFARTVTLALAIVLRIYEELYAYQNAKSLGEQWRKQSDSLFYLLCEGLRLKETLLRLSFVARKSGDPEMAQHFTLTAEKLETNLAKVSELF